MAHSAANDVSGNTLTQTERAVTIRSRPANTKGAVPTARPLPELGTRGSATSALDMGAGPAGRQARPQPWQCRERPTNGPCTDPSDTPVAQDRSRPQPQWRNDAATSAEVHGPKGCWRRLKHPYRPHGTIGTRNGHQATAYATPTGPQKWGWTAHAAPPDAEQSSRPPPDGQESYRDPCASGTRRVRRTEPCPHGTAASCAVPPE